MFRWRKPAHHHVTDSHSLEHATRASLPQSPLIYRVLFIVYITTVALFVWNAFPSHSDSMETFDPATYLRKVPATKLRPWRYSLQEGDWVQGPTTLTDELSPTELRIATYNIWFGARKDSFEEKTKVRALAMLEELRKESPHIISLQEMTKPILMLVLEQEWIRKDYWITDGMKLNNFHRGYGAIMLSNLPYKQINLQDLPSQLGRKAIRADFVLGGEKFCVVNTHLESYPTDFVTRQQQLRVISRITTPKVCPQTLIMGDFNFESEQERPKLINSSYYVDTWQFLHPSDPGYTFDTEKNLLAKKTASEESSVQQKRLDVMLLHSEGNKWSPTHADLIGTEPISSNPELFPSDHFGLVATFEAQSSPNVLYE
eukprot:TRINITY_DN3400_c0_g1_i1.p1 TRINITY_DN3400_c0_g1~~TRINITY_DN3400_c0_g1_i1.p1  ORF type:complete len:372 (+),score=45.41 TRINITY_DN3400_c0_g1_i1:150-1265(+)